MKPGSGTIQHVMLQQRVDTDINGVRSARQGMGNQQMAEHRLKNSAKALEEYEKQYTSNPKTNKDAERKARL